MEYCYAFVGNRIKRSSHPYDRFKEKRFLVSGTDKYDILLGPDEGNSF